MKTMVLHLTSCLMALVMMTASTVGFQSYNSGKQICCNGTVNDVSEPPYEYGCCGNQPYKYGESICCEDNIVAPVPEAGYNSFSYGCCLDENTAEPIVFNTTTHICCDGRLNEIEEDKWLGCCANQAFKYSTEFCCDGQVYEESDNVACCSNEVVYDPTSQICCELWQEKDGEWLSQYQLYDKSSDTSECCELALYDTTTHVCCDETIVDRPEDMAGDSLLGCCGGQIYDLDIQECCNRWVLVDQKYEIVSSKVNDKIGNQSLCCEENLYDYDEEVCCNDGLVLAKPEGTEEERRSMYCCGGEIVSYANNEQRCFNDKLVTVDNENMWICGDEMYDFSTHDCCNDVIYDRMVTDPAVDDSCCYGAGETFSSQTDLCCDDVVVSKEDLEAKEGDDACCTPNNYW